LDKTKINTDFIYRVIPSVDEINEVTDKKGSLVYTMDKFPMHNVPKGFVAIFYDSKDLAKSVLNQLKDDGFKFESPLQVISQKIDEEAKKAEAKTKNK
jgi:hypothetical protein